MRYIATILTLLASYTAAAPPKLEYRATNLPAASQVTIESINYAGSGCPSGSVAGTFSDDRTLVTLAFDTYVAQSGSSIAPKENRKACQLTLKMHFPGGWQYVSNHHILHFWTRSLILSLRFSIFKADYRGYVSLPAKAKSFCSSTYYFSGADQTSQVARSKWFTGPIAGQSYYKSDEVGLDSTVWSPCGQEGMLNIKSEIGILPGGSTAASVMTVSDTRVYTPTLQ
jgi:hypothetical protein